LPSKRSSRVAHENREVGMRQVTLFDAKDDLSRYLAETESGEILLTRRVTVAMLIGFASEDDWATIVSRMASVLPNELHPLSPTRGSGSKISSPEFLGSTASCRSASLSACGALKSCSFIRKIGMPCRTRLCLMSRTLLLS
jgi:antitoxin (DNA-binding transcriptional repressor) of toxin-antitoxin stability system